MIKRKILKASIVILPVLVLFIIAGGCAKKITGDSNQELTLKIDAGLARLVEAEEIQLFRLTVTGLGIINPIRAELTLIEGFLYGSVIVPAGPDRLFVIEALDEGGATIYRGETIVDIEPNVDLAISINLYPQVPMIKLTPSFLERPQGATVAVKVKIYNLPDINTIIARVDNFNEDSVITLFYDSVVMNPGLGAAVNLSIVPMDERALYFRVNHNLPDFPIVDDSGYAFLATIYYPTYSLDPVVDTFNFLPEVFFLQDIAGNELVMENIVNENSMVELYKLSYHTIAYWMMNGDDSDPNLVFDNSDNALHGVSSGAYIGEGVFGNARFFSGEGDFITVPYQAPLNLTDEITISLWLYVDSTLDDGAIMSRRLTDGSINYQLSIRDPSSAEGIVLYFEYGDFILNQYLAEIPDLMDDMWHHVVFSYKFGRPSTATFIVDTELYDGEWTIGRGEENAPVITEDLLLGINNATGQNFFEGGLDELTIFDVAFDLDIVRQLPYWQK